MSLTSKRISRSPALRAVLALLAAAGAAGPAAGEAADAAQSRTMTTSERAQRLAKLEEDLSSNDPNLQLAALEQALEAGSLAERQRAYGLAFASSNALLRGVALRYRICERRSLALQYNVPPNYGPNGYAKYRGFNFLAGVTTLSVAQCSSDTGQFAFTVPGEQGSASAGTGTISGTDVELRFVVRPASYRWDVVCDASFSLSERSEMTGRLACRYTDETFGPVATVVRY